MDDLDRAKTLEIEQRQRAIQAALNAPDHDYGEKQDIVDGIHYCIDCGNDIPVERLAIRPSAVRCVDCKEIWEKDKC